MRTLWPIRRRPGYPIDQHQPDQLPGVGFITARLDEHHTILCSRVEMGFFHLLEGEESGLACSYDVEGGSSVVHFRH